MEPGTHTAEGSAAIAAASPASQRNAFLSADFARPGEKKLAWFVVAVSVIAFIAAAPSFRLPMAPIPPFSPGYEAAVGATSSVTAALLFGQFARLRSRALLLLACGYLFNALMVVVHGLSLPHESAIHLPASGPQTTVWLYTFWHAGFALSVLAYAILCGHRSDHVAGLPSRSIILGISFVTLGVVTLTVLTTAGHDFLPALIRPDDHLQQFPNPVSPLLWLLCVTVLLVLAWRSVPTVLEVWLMVAMAAWTFDVTCSMVVGAHRSDVGFYAGRFYGFVSAFFVLGALLSEMNRLYGRLADALALAETRNNELARSREEFARVQRFEAIGQLVGGVAHDFNNLLTVITGALDLTLRENSLPPRARRMLDMSMAAAHRGSEMTGQLLTFARKQVLQPEVLNINEVIANLETFIARATGETVQVVMELSPVLWPARLDRAQFETALINLVLNARDASNGEGRVVISTRNVAVDAATGLDVPAGEYVLASVADAGAGMTPEVVARAVDPFFTTKDIGKGSGLGLSQVYGFARGALGGLRIDSAPGRGTTVEIYLPKSVERAPAQPQQFGLIPIRAACDDETILVVEDDPDVLNVAVSGLLDLGYDVRATTNAQEAMDILRGDTKIDVLFSDVVMPGGINGAQLAVEARRVRPNLKVLLTSGYTASALTEDHGLSERLEVLPKPYRREDLASKLRLVIGN